MNNLDFLSSIINLTYPIGIGKIMGFKGYDAGPKPGLGVMMQGRFRGYDAGAV
jgi:hypothetical protein